MPGVDTMATLGRPGCTPTDASSCSQGCWFGLSTFRKQSSPFSPRRTVMRRFGKSPHHQELCTRRDDLWLPCARPGSLSGQFLGPSEFLQPQVVLLPSQSPPKAILSLPVWGGLTVWGSPRVLDFGRCCHPCHNGQAVLCGVHHSRASPNPY